MTNTMNKDSTPYAIVSVSYDGLCKRLYIIFSMASVHIDIFARPAVYCCNSHTAQLVKLKPI